MSCLKISPRPTIDLDALDPGIRRVVAMLHQAGFKTTDSGDGVSKDKAMECAIDVPNVFMVVEPASQAIREAKRLRRFLWQRGIHLGPVGGDAPFLQQSFDPATGHAVLALCGVDDAVLVAAQAWCAAGARALAAEMRCARSGHVPQGAGQCRCGWRGDQD